MVRFHHVNLGIPVGGAEAEGEFLIDVLGYSRLESPAEFAGIAKWYVGEDGKEIHLSEDPEHRPAARAHVAITLDDDLSGLTERLKARGEEVNVYSNADLSLVFCRDPAGNQWEIRGAPTG